MFSRCVAAGCMGTEPRAVLDFAGFGLQPQSTLKGTEMSKRGNATDALWKPTSTLTQQLLLVSSYPTLSLTSTCLL